MSASIAVFALVACNDSGLSAEPRVRFAPAAPMGAGPDDTGLPEAAEPTEPSSGTGTDTGTDLGTDTGTDSGTATETEPTDPGTGAPLEACYPGADESWTTCFPLVAPSPLPAEYVYPAPLDGSGQYAEPLHYLDLDTIDPTTSVAPNFVLDELAQDWKGRYAVVQPRAVESLQACRDQVGAIVVNSGYRSPDYNAGVGGATWSRHMYGDAFDLDPVAVDLDGMADACWDNGASFVSMYVSHVHCDWRDDPMDVGFYGGARGGLFGLGLVPAVWAEVVADGAELIAPAEGFDEGEPLRRWVALDAAGVAIAAGEGSRFLPPPQAAEVEVTVGGLVTVRTAL